MLQGNFKVKDDCKFVSWWWFWRWGESVRNWMRQFVLLRFFENTWAGWNRAISLSFVCVEVWEWIVQSGGTLPEDVPFGWKLRARLWWFQIVGSSGDTEIIDMVMLTACVQCWSRGTKWDEDWIQAAQKRHKLPFLNNRLYIKLLFYFLEWAFFSWLYPNYEKVLLCFIVRLSYKKEDS